MIELSIVNDKCKGDEITTEFTVDAITFDIGVTAEVSIQPIWNANSIPGCPSTFKLFRQVGSEEPRALTDEESELVTFDYLEGKFVLISNTDDFGVEGETWKL